MKLSVYFFTLFIIELVKLLYKSFFPYLYLVIFAWSTKLFVYFFISFIIEMVKMSMHSFLPCFCLFISWYPCLVRIALNNKMFRPATAKLTFKEPSEGNGQWTPDPNPGQLFILSWQTCYSKVSNLHKILHRLLQVKPILHFKCMFIPFNLWMFQKLVFKLKQFCFA